MKFDQFNEPVLPPSRRRGGYRCSAINSVSGNQCTRDAKWWWRKSHTSAWVPVCGLHAYIPPFGGRSRAPISEKPPT